MTRGDSGLRKDSVALIPLVTALDKMCFVERISHLGDGIIDEIYHSVMELLH